MIYRSTLDPALRMEEKRGITEVGALILATLGLYLTITPGVLGGFVDYYVLRPLLGQKRYTIDDFVVKDKLGEGGMGEVWRAQDTTLGREVAIKVLPEAFTADAERLARFEREARVLAACICGAALELGPSQWAPRAAAGLVDGLSRHVDARQEASEQERH